MIAYKLDGNDHVPLGGKTGPSQPRRIVVTSIAALLSKMGTAFDLCIVAMPIIAVPVYLATGFNAVDPPGVIKLGGRTVAGGVTARGVVGGGALVRANLGTVAQRFNIASSAAASSRCALVSCFFFTGSLYQRLTRL